MLRTVNSSPKKISAQQVLNNQGRNGTLPVRRILTRPFFWIVRSLTTPALLEHDGECSQEVWISRNWLPEFGTSPHFLVSEYTPQGKLDPNAHSPNKCAQLRFASMSKAKSRLQRNHLLLL
jgi:hypothetical protein